MYGRDPNWGRIAAACGAAGININPGKVEIGFGKTPVFKNGVCVKTDYNRLKNLLSGREIEANINLNQGRAKGFVWTCDLTEKYVRINARYE